MARPKGQVLNKKESGWGVRRPRAKQWHSKIRWHFLVEVQGGVSLWDNGTRLVVLVRGRSRGPGSARRLSASRWLVPASDQTPCLHSKSQPDKRRTRSAPGLLAV